MQIHWGISCGEKHLANSGALGWLGLFVNGSVLRYLDKWCRGFDFRRL